MPSIGFILGIGSCALRSYHFYDMSKEESNHSYIGDCLLIKQNG